MITEPVYLVVTRNRFIDLAQILRVFLEASGGRGIRLPILPRGIATGGTLFFEARPGSGIVEGQRRLCCLTG